MWKKFVLILVFYVAGFFTAVYLLGSAEATNYSRAEILAGKMHVQLCKVVKIIDEKASKVGNVTSQQLAKKL